MSDVTPSTTPKAHKHAGQAAAASIDTAAAERWRRCAPPHTPWLHEEVARRMAERLDWIKLQPQSWLHWSPVRGGLQTHAQIAQRYPRAMAYLYEEAWRQNATQVLLRRWWSPSTWRRRVQSLESLQSGLPPPQGVDMLWANMVLHTEPQAPALLRQWHTLLAVDGFLMFSCLGPNTLQQLRTLYARMGWPPPAQDFVDMHNWGDELVKQGFSQPVMDMEQITLRFANPERLLLELRDLGANAHPLRFSGLRGRAWRQRLLQELGHLAQPSTAKHAQDGGIAIDFEIVYGHAIKAAARQPGLNTIGLDQVRSTLPSQKKS